MRLMEVSNPSRISTGKRDLAEAKEYARDAFLEYKFQHKMIYPL